MNKKNILCFVILIAFLFAGIQTAFASPVVPKIKEKSEVNLEEDDKNCSESELIKRVSLKNKFQKSPEDQISSFLKKYNRYSEKNNFKKLREMYTDNFVNNDGFDKNTIFKMMEMASESYKNIKYNTNIDEITVEGKYAVVKATETATAQTDSLASKINDTGFVESKTNYIDYLVKEGNEWKIQVTEVLSEEVTMKYGEAKNMDIKITAPLSVPSGTEYEVSVYANTPDGSFAIGSIVNERIVFPQEEKKDVFRAIKSEKLARVLTANKDNNNEYATVSIALTRAEVEPPAVNINMTGMAFAMKRINTIPFAKQENNEASDADKKRK